MASMLDIGRSALSAYGGALAVTSGNIANASTEGYRRRTQLQSEQTALAASVTDASTMGGGVRIGDVQRAQDALVASRLRNAQAGAAGAGAQLTVMRDLETLLATGAGSFDTQAQRFFGALSDLANNPGDRAGRNVVLAEGAAMAESLSGLAGRISDLRGETMARLQQVAAQAGGVLSALAGLNAALPGVGSGGERAVLLDRRDQLLAELSSLTGTQVEFDGFGRARVTLGTRPGGPVVLEGATAARLSMGEGPALSVALPGQPVATTRSFLAGQMGGLADGLAAIDAVASDIDMQARAMATAMNAAHRAGLTPEGARGGDLFAVDGWRVDGALAAGVSLRMTGGAAPDGPIVLTRSGGEWLAVDGAGEELGRAPSTLVLPGLVLSLPEAPEGARLTLSATSGAAHFRLAISDPLMLAAAAATRVVADAANIGSAAVTIQRLDAPAATLPALPGTDPALALEFLSAGVAGTLHAPGGDAMLTAPAVLRSLAAPVPGSVTRIDLTIDGTTHAIDIPGIADASALAQMLNDGPLGAFGAMARVDEDGLLRLETAPGRAISAVLQGSGGAQAMALVDPGAEAAGLVILTREGKQIAGPPLSADAARALLTPANGFATGARYEMAMQGYRGMGLMVLPGQNETLRLVPDGSALGIEVAGQNWSLTPPLGANAAQIAGLLRGLDPATGLDWQARTDVVVQGFADGPVALALGTPGGAEVLIDASITQGRADLLAAAINRATAVTGIQAELSDDGMRLHLSDPSGRDISLRLVSGASLTATPVDLDATARAPATPLVQGETQRFGGQLLADGTGSFRVTQGGVSLTSAAPAVASPIRATFAEAGEGVALSFPAAPPQVEPPAQWWVETAGERVSVAVAPGASIAGALAEALNARGIDARLDGETLVLRDPALRAGVDTAGQALWMTDLPDEPLIVVMTDQGLPRLGGWITDSPQPAPGGVELRVLDAASGRIGLYDSATGDAIADGYLGADGVAQLGGHVIALGSGFATGDRFRLEPNTSAAGDSRTLDVLAGLRSQTLARHRETLVVQGSQTRALEGKSLAADAIREAAQRADAELSAVDLDAEAARLIQLQQGYQASAQTLQIARSLFETLLNAL